MAINVTTRKVDVASTGRSNEELTVSLECENTSDVEIYSSTGVKYRNGIDYNVTNNTIPGVSINRITVTWVGTSPDGTLTVYRTSPRTRTTSLVSGFTNNLLENSLDRMTLASQNAPSTTNSVFDIDGDNIQVVGDPINDTDVANLGYMQAEYSKGGYICPPITTVDAGLSGTGKVLYAKSTSSVIWKDPFDVPFPAAADKVLQVNGLGVPTWVSPPDYAPAYPTLEPMYLGVGSSAKAWIAVDQVPTLTKGTVGDTLVFQYGSKPAWQTIRWLDDLPGSNKHLFNCTGGGTGGGTSIETVSLVSAAKSCCVTEDDTDRNDGAILKTNMKGKTDEAKVAIMEFDCSAFSAASHTMDTLVSCYLKIYFTTSGTGHSSSPARQFVVKRLKNTFTEGTGNSGNSYNDDGATWAKPTAPGGTPDWNWGGGNFSPEKETDQELPTPYFAIGSGMTTNAFTYIDIKELFLDAIRNRSGILRIAIYDPAPTSSSRYAKFFSNTGNANDVKVEVRNANARKAYWQPWNYYLKRSYMNGVPGEGPLVQATHFWKTNPHMFASPSHVDGELSAIKGGHVEQGKTFACDFTFANTNPIQTYQSFCYPLVCVNSDNESLTHFADLTIPFYGITWDGHNNMTHNLSLRTSTIWLADE